MSRKYRFCPRCGKELVKGERGGTQRKLCPDEACGFVHWNNPLPVVAALVEHEGEIILARQAHWPDTWYGIITGFLEKDETPEEGVLRELKEELDLDGTIESLIGVHAFPMRNEVIISYHVKATGTITLSDELEAIKRVQPHKLRGWDFGTGLAVKEWVDAQNFEDTFST